MAAMKTQGGQANSARAWGAYVEEEDLEEAPNDHPAQIGAMYRAILPYSLDTRPQLTPINEDF